MGKDLSRQELIDLLAGVKRALIVSHYNPDADAYGSSIGLAKGLALLGVSVQVVNESGTSASFAFLPGVPEVTKGETLAPYDYVIATDCGDQKRLGDTLGPKLVGTAPLVNIDHHHSNNRFGDFNYVLGDLSSTSEMIADILLGLEEKKKTKAISPEVAKLLFAGISADTGSFKYSSTKASTFLACVTLLERGASPAEIAQGLYSQNSLASVKIHAEALTALTLSCGGRVGEVVVTGEMMKKYGATAEDTEGLVEQVRNVAGVDVAVFIREEDGFFKASLRSRGPAQDVSAIAVSFGGGGHKAAAGFRWRKSLSELREALKPKLEALF